jgi:ribonuclease P protein component
MLPAANRMRAAADFTHTTRRGAKVARGSVVVYVAAVEGAGPPRIGLVVNKAVGNSVIRHRAARRIRGAVTPLVRSLPSGTLIVVRALPGADTDPALAASIADGVAAGLVRAGSSE